MEIKKDVFYLICAECFFALIIIGIIIFQINFVSASTEISTCSVLNSAGETYLLTADIINDGSQVCMSIQADNITLDCQGHLIDGDGISGEYGTATGYLDDSPYNNVTIKNCVLSDWDYVVFFKNSSNSSILNNILTNSYYGIDLEAVSNFVILNNTVECTDATCIYLDTNFGLGGSMNNSITSNSLVSSDNYATLIYFGTAENNTASHNVLSGGVVELLNPNNLIYNNLINLTTISTGYINNFWNTTFQSGSRIYSNGNNIGGNYWTKNGECQGTSTPCEDILESGNCNEQLYCYWDVTCLDDGLLTCEEVGNSLDCGTQDGCTWNYSVKGYSDTCTDADTDGFCDSPLNITNMVSCTAGVDCGNNVDYLPYSNKYSSSCAIQLADDSYYVPKGCTCYYPGSLSMDYLNISKFSCV